MITYEDVLARNFKKLDFDCYVTMREFGRNPLLFEKTLFKKHTKKGTIRFFVSWIFQPGEEESECELIRECDDEVGFTMRLEDTPTLDSVLDLFGKLPKENDNDCSKICDFINGGETLSPVGPR